MVLKKTLLVACVTGTYVCIIIFLNGQMDTTTRVFKTFKQRFLYGNTTAIPSKLGQKDLFLIPDNKSLPQYPVFVSAFSSNHYLEGLAMIDNFKKIFKGSRKLIVYDIGLTSAEVKQVKKKCGCEVRRFPFEKYPKHIGTLKGCPWKPIVIQVIIENLSGMQLEARKGCGDSTGARNTRNPLLVAPVAAI